MRKFTVNFACFGYADVIKYQEKPTISCERADFYSSHHQRARGHKTIGSHLNFGAYGLRTFAPVGYLRIVLCLFLKARPRAKPFI